MKPKEQIKGIWHLWGNIRDLLQTTYRSKKIGDTYDYLEESITNALRNLLEKI